MKNVQNECVRDDPWCWFSCFPTAIRAGRNLQALSIQGLTDLLDCVAVFALLVEELGD